MTESNKSLLIIDAMALLFRSYYAMQRANMRLKDGTPIGATYGFLKILFKLLKEQQPSHFAITWDLKEPTFRHRDYPLYKAHRSQFPEELIPQLNLLKKLLETCKFPCFSYSGYEGDDCAGTLARWFEHQGKVLIVTSDKDFMQLVNDSIQLVSLKSGDQYEIIGHSGVEDYFGVPPCKVVEILSLAGDSSDNVPGVKGMGHKSAAKLMQKFNTVEELYDNLSQVDNARIKRLLEEHRENVFLSKHLVTIQTQVPLLIEENKMLFDWQLITHDQQLKHELQNLEMTSLIKFLSPQQTLWPEAVEEHSKYQKNSAENNTEIKVQNKEKWKQRQYILVKNQTQFNEVLRQISSTETKQFAFDTETTGLNTLDDIPIGFSVCFESGTAYYVPAHQIHLADCDMGSIDAKQIWAELNQAFKTRSATLVGHNIKYDLHMLSNVNVSWGEHAPVACSMVAAWLLDPGTGGYGLDAQTFKVLQLEKIPTSQLIGKGTGRQGMLDVPLFELADYACEDADATMRLWEKISTQITQQELASLFWDIEMPVLQILLQMERSGIYIDTSYLKQLEQKTQKKLSELIEQIYEATQERFNISSPKQLGQVLFEKLKIHEHTPSFKGKLKKTSLGFKTSAGVLDDFSEHPVVKLILDYRETQKLLSTYISALPELVNKKTHRIHTHFNQIGTVTGRLSSSDPNLQNIPVRTDFGKTVRQAFCAQKENTVLISADYSQIELRVLAHMTKDAELIKAFLNGADIHKQTAAKLWGVDLDKVTQQQRNRAKTINFGIVYGMGAQRLSREENISLQEAKSFIDKYFMSFPKIQEFMHQNIHNAHETGIVKTLFQRPRFIRGIESKDAAILRAAEFTATNSPIQGSAADIMKIGMIHTAKGLIAHNLSANILLQVHDELVLECPINELELTMHVVRESLENVIPEFLVPLTVEVKYGKNWLEAK